MKNIVVGSRIGLFVNPLLLESHILHANNRMIREFEKNSYSDTYFHLLAIRGITYLEYLQLFDQQIKEEDFLDYLSFQFVGVDSEYGYFDGKKYMHGRKDYTNQYEANEKDYLKLLHTFPKFIESLEQQKSDTTIPYIRMWEHTYINGASGSGKSTLIKSLIHTLSEKENGIILIDPQGKLAREVRALKSIDTKRLVYIKPNLKKGYSPTINFLEKEKDIDTNTMALRLARVISIISQGELSNPMISLLRPCLAVLIDQGGYNLSDLKRFLVKEENEDLVQLGLAHSDQEYQSTFKRINTGYYSKTRDAIISKLDVVLQDQYFRQLTSGKSTIPLNAALKQGKIIIFDLGGLDTDTIQAFGRLLVALILQIALERDTAKMEDIKRTFLFIDEMQNFLSPDLIKILDEARQKKLHLVMAHQRIGQLKAHIKTNVEENFIDSMMGNTAIKIVGHNDSPDTINILSSKLGMDKEKLIGIPNYEFILRVRGQKDIHFMSSNAVNDSALYLSAKELQHRDNYMAQKYYAPIASSSISSQKKKAVEKETITKVDAPTSKTIVLDEDDF